MYLECDKHGIGGGSKHFNDNDAQPVRRIGGCDKHCIYNDAQPGRFSHGQRGRKVRYADTIINAHHVR